jgi:bifunctional DNA-binding transcriptional regulator/antitoxin component of YhaV-PrlF toxin-antitoxin module
MIVTVDSKRRLTLPAALMRVKPGQSFDAQFDADEDALIFRRLPEKEDWLEVLAECPVPMDDVPPRRRELPKKRKM